MEDPNNNKFESRAIFNYIRVKSFLGEVLPNDQKIFICGKMFEHSTLTKYYFKSSEFLVYCPFNNKLYSSEMYSDDSFSDSLKWNNNYFKKIRACLDSSEWIKNTYFIISYEDNNNIKSMENTAENNNDIIIDNELEIQEVNTEVVNKDEIDIDKEMNNNFIKDKMYLELHFIVESHDIVAFKLLLQEYKEDKPQFVILNKLLDYDKSESQIYNQKIDKTIKLEEEINKMEKEINIEKDQLEMRKKQYLYKFYYLNKEKNKKINELSYNRDNLLNNI